MVRTEITKSMFEKYVSVSVSEKWTLCSGCDDDKKLKVDFRSISCKVCNAPSSGFHFGAITCEGCKVSLRTTVVDSVL